MNNQTVVGVFETAEAAARAVADLKTANFATESVDHANRSATNTVGNQEPLGGADAHVNTSGTWAEGVADKVDQGTSAIGRFFSNLFSDDEETATRYTGVANNSQSIVTVHADSDARAHEAAAILDRCGAVDVDERAQEMGWNAQTGWNNNDAMQNRTAAPGETLKVVEGKPECRQERSGNRRHPPALPRSKPSGRRAAAPPRRACVCKPHTGRPRSHRSRLQHF